ncbi:thiamine phosphate synthase [Holophaga foetida]|uniref:thiamine phosphate synthase n=1 Tax=Holophaga foetida TaxID=35839 RepID=UPI0005BC3E5D|nr:thiamine phosphate synthase [Holophaga foetida]
MKGLCLVTDRGACAGRPLEEVVRLALQGGIASVQLREKDLGTRDFVTQAKALKALLGATPLIINDRVDVALACGAAGVHVGQSDMDPSDARRILGSGAIIGLSVETWEDVERAQQQPVDYLGVSPVFGTPTKTNTKGAWGLEGIARIRTFSRHPLVAIGGIHAGNVEAIVRAGAEGIAVVSAICGAEDPEAATRSLAGGIRRAQT